MDLEKKSENSVEQKKPSSIQEKLIETLHFENLENIDWEYSLPNWFWSENNTYSKANEVLKSIEKFLEKKYWEKILLSLHTQNHSKFVVKKTS